MSSAEVPQEQTSQLPTADSRPPAAVAHGPAAGASTGRPSCRDSPDRGVRPTRLVAMLEAKGCAPPARSAHVVARRRDVGLGAVEPRPCAAQRERPRPVHEWSRLLVRLAQRAVRAYAACRGCLSVLARVRPASPADHPAAVRSPRDPVVEGDRCRLLLAARPAVLGVARPCTGRGGLRAPVGQRECVPRPHACAGFTCALIAERWRCSRRSRPRSASCGSSCGGVRSLRQLGLTTAAIALASPSVDPALWVAWLAFLVAQSQHGA